MATPTLPRGHGASCPHYQRDKNNLPTIPLDDLPDPYENVSEKIDAQFQYFALQTVFESIRAGRIELSPLHREVFDTCIEGVESPSDFAKRNGLHPNTVIQIKKLLIEKFKNSPMRIKRINEFVLTRHLST